MSVAGGSSKRVVLTGPESTGKSRLTAHLSHCFGVPRAMEYARAYLEAHGPGYDFEGVREMARKHLAWQRLHVPESAALGVLDTDMINYKIWFEVVYGRCPPEVLDALESETNHVYLLCAPDVPWAPDPLRENPNDRPMLFERHRAEIERLRRAYVVVEGVNEARVANAEAGFRRLAGGGGLHDCVIA
ncbi:MAG: ATP-binding protein [Lentisphaerae bacterium]|nr:ATP-binding protein [Lentisphaerota bacterium]